MGPSSWWIVWRARTQHFEEIESELRVRPTLFINKVDRLFLELQEEPEDTYQRFVNIINNVNADIVSSGAGGWEEPQVDGVVGSSSGYSVLVDTLRTAIPQGLIPWDLQEHTCMFLAAGLSVDPVKGTVVFGSGLHGWGFTLQQFARLYASKFGVCEERMCERLWGEHYYDPQNKRWSRQGTNAQGVKLQRSFCQFILGPLHQIHAAVMEEQHDKVESICGKLRITLNSTERDLSPKKKLKCLLGKWLPVSDSVLEMTVKYLPSAKKAQGYRALQMLGPEAVEQIGGEHSPVLKGIRECDYRAPLVCIVSRMMPTVDNGRLFAFGRILSGTLRTGMACRIRASEQQKQQEGPASVETKEDHQRAPEQGGPLMSQQGPPPLWVVKRIQRVVLLNGWSSEAMEDLPSGAPVGVVGVDRWLPTLTSSGLLTDPAMHEELDSLPPTVG